MQKMIFMQERRTERTGLQHENAVIEKISFYVIVLAKKEGIQAFLLCSKIIQCPSFSRFSDIFQFFLLFPFIQIPDFSKKMRIFEFLCPESV